MKAIQFSETGDAADVIGLVDAPEPGEPSVGQVLVETLYSPVNFHDVYFIAGFLIPPTLPAVPGNEGIGRVLAAGEGVSNVAVGDVVVFPLLQGAWRERLLIPASGLAPLPGGDLEQFAMLGSNTPTAGLALSEFVDLEPGAWVVQSSANGGVGRNVIALAKARGFRTANLVRRADVADELTAAGADLVVLEGPRAADEIDEGTNGAQIQLGIDSVGGKVASTILRVLAPGATLVTYNNASGEGVDANAAAAKNIAIKSIFVGAFDYTAKVAPIIDEAVPLVQAGELHVPVEAVYPLSEVKEAIAHLRRGGKILLRVTA